MTKAPLQLTTITSLIARRDFPITFAAFRVDSLTRKAGVICCWNDGNVVTWPSSKPIMRPMLERPTSILQDFFFGGLGALKENSERAMTYRHVGAKYDRKVVI
jgi:hypothetical protein